MQKKLLAAILLLFLFTRLYKIDSIPTSLYWDEASIGYNAYSILKTGADEWDQSFPVHFRAFGEFKLPVYIYSTVIPIYLFGLNEFAVRLSAVLFSFGTVILVYLVGLKTFHEPKAAFLSSLILVTSPWFFIFSRTGFEATSGVLFFIGGLFFFLTASKNRWLILLSTACFILSMYSYNSFRVIVPLTIIPLAYTFIQNKKSKALVLIMALSISALVVSLVPIIRVMTEEGSRLQTVSIIQSEIPHYESAALFITNYFSHLTPEFLFISGDSNIRHQVPHFGQLQWIIAPFLLYGLYISFKTKRYMLVYLLIISIIPAAITKESPHALRAILAIPMISLISGYGIVELSKEIRYSKYFIILSTVTILGLFGWFFYQFTNTYSQQAASSWQYGYKYIFQNYSQEFKNYNEVLITDRYNQPYIFALFYLSYDPNLLRDQAQYNSIDKWYLSVIERLDNLRFTAVTAQKVATGKKLIFASPEEKLDNIREREIIRNLDGSVAFYVYEKD